MTTPTTDAVNVSIKPHTLDSDSGSDTMKFFETDSDNLSEQEEPFSNTNNDAVPLAYTISGGQLSTHVWYV